MTPEQLFLIRYDQLGNCLQKQDTESMLQLSQVLRQMIVDGDRLIDIVNKKHQVRVRFYVGLSTIEREQEMVKIGISDTSVHFLGAFPPNEAKKNIKIKDFLKFTVVKYNDSHFDVITLIKTCANRLGGVHIGEEDKDDPIEKDVRKLGELLKKLGLNGAFSTLVIIGSTVHKALKPLIEKIK